MIAECQLGSGGSPHSVRNLQLGSTRIQVAKRKVSASMPEEGAGQANIEMNVVRLADYRIGPPTDNFTIQRRTVMEIRSHCSFCNWSSFWTNDRRGAINAKEELRFHVKERHPEYDARRID